jgi:hypothetical protein
MRAQRRLHAGGGRAMNHLDYYRFDNLADEWRRKNVRLLIVQALTLSTLIMILCTPMLWSVAPLVDAIGIDGLMMLFEINLMIGMALFFGPAFAPVRRWLDRTGVMITRKEAWSLFAQKGWHQ